MGIIRHNYAAPNSFSIAHQRRECDRAGQEGASEFFLELVDSVDSLTGGVVDQIVAGENEYAENPMPRELLHSIVRENISALLAASGTRA